MLEKGEMEMNKPIKISNTPSYNANRINTMTYYLDMVFGYAKELNSKYYSLLKRDLIGTITISDLIRGMLIYDGTDSYDWTIAKNTFKRNVRDSSEIEHCTKKMEITYSEEEVQKMEEYLSKVLGEAAILNPSSFSLLANDILAVSLRGINPENMDSWNSAKLLIKKMLEMQKTEDNSQNITKALHK